MKSETKTGKFKVPKEHAEAGNEKTFNYTFDVATSEADAHALCNKHEWTFLTLVNDAEEARSRANAYQNAVMPYRPTTKTPDEIREGIVRDYIRLGLSEDAARAQVDALLAASK